MATTAGQFNLWDNALTNVRRVLVGWGAGIVLGMAVGVAMATIPPTHVGAS